MATLSIIIPANNEAARIKDCLDALLTQRGIDPDHRIEIIVVANGCEDATAKVALEAAARCTARGWTLRVQELAEGGKPAALNAGDQFASSGARLYLDADVICGPGLLAGLLAELSQPGPIYAGARLVVAPNRSLISRIYGRFWQRLPFHTRGVTGAGLFAVNAEARQRWVGFPTIIADDAFVRSLFSPAERRRIEAEYSWPLSEGFRDLVRVRRRQDAGVQELARFRPDLKSGGDHPSRSELRDLVLADPLGFVVYAAVAMATRLGRADGHWARRRS